MPACKMEDSFQRASTHTNYFLNLYNLNICEFQRLSAIKHRKNAALDRLINCCHYILLYKNVTILLQDGNELSCFCLIETFS